MKTPAPAPKNDALPKTLPENMGDDFPNVLSDSSFGEDYRSSFAFQEDFVAGDILASVHSEGSSEKMPEFPLPEFDEDTPADDAAPSSSEKDTLEVVGVRFKPVGKMYYFDPNHISFSLGDHAIVDTARGEEYGEVCLANTRVPSSGITPPLRSALRIATKEDIQHNLDNKTREEEAFKICLEKISKHELDMKLVDAQYTFDNSKLLFYFTSSGRVDFRELVKDLASVFRTRIELRQIGIRDEAKLMGGLGTCGRPLCCASFLSDFAQVTIKMAKEQNLSLNSAKISGNCGRLMCCLHFEHEIYEEEIEKTPPVDSIVETPDGKGTVVDTSPLLHTVKVRLSDSDSSPKSYPRDAVKVLSRPASAEQDK